MDCRHRVMWAAVLLSGMTAFAEQPPAQGHAPAEFFATPDGIGGPTPGARFLATLPFSARETLRKEGRVVLDHKKGKTNGLVRAVIRFERPRDEVFGLITQPSQQARYLANVKASKTVGGRTAESELVDMEVAVLFVKMNYRIQHWFYPAEFRMEWELDPSVKCGLSEQTGFFQLYALDEKTTIAEYGARVIAKDGFLDFVRGLGERGGIAEALSALRIHVAAPR